MVEVKRERTHVDATPIWDLHRGGQFIIGASSEEEIAKQRAKLDATQWTVLHLYGPVDDPVKWIEHVREEKWTFREGTYLDKGKDGRVFFAGNINEYSAAFRFLILDTALVATISSLAPEVPLRG